MDSVLDFAAIFQRLADADEREHRAVLDGVEIRCVSLPPGSAGQWDRHNDSTETVLVWDGTFEVGYRDRTDVLTPGQCCVVPTGAEHQGRAPNGAKIILFKNVPAA